MIKWGLVSTLVLFWLLCFVLVSCLWFLVSLVIGDYSAAHRRPSFAIQVFTTHTSVYNETFA